MNWSKFGILAGGLLAGTAGVKLLSNIEAVQSSYRTPNAPAAFMKKPVDKPLEK